MYHYGNGNDNTVMIILFFNVLTISLNLSDAVVLSPSLGLASPLGLVAKGFLMCAVVVVGIALTIAYPLAFIIMGALHLDQCNVEPKIPVWLIVEGSSVCIFA